MLFLPFYIKLLFDRSDPRVLLKRWVAVLLYTVVFGMMGWLMSMPVPTEPRPPLEHESQYLDKKAKEWIEHILD